MITLLLRFLFPILTALLFVATVFAAPLPAREPVLVVDELEALRALETAGYALPAFFQAPQAATTEALTAASPAYAAIAQILLADVAALRAEMAANGRKLYEVTDGNVGRVLDGRWLQSPLAQFRLVGIVNRLDRRDFGGPEGTCGETRLIYRLAYRFTGRKGRLYASRLPVSVSLVLEQLGDCRAAAAAWVPGEALETPGAIAGWLAANALSPGRVRLKQIEINAQIVRFPSGQETEFGGQAVYLMRIFTASMMEGKLAVTERPLENTPDVARLQADPTLRADLVAFLRDHAEAADQGTIMVPDRFLAVKALTYSTFGPLRAANRPFAAVLAPDDFEGTTAAGFRVVRSTRGMIERLDQMSCMGCHQSNGTAGFHFFGLDVDETSRLKAVKLGAWPIFGADQPRRAAYVQALLDGRAPDTFRPLPNAPPADWSGAAPAYAAARPGMACIPEAAQADLAGWSCDASTVCETVAANPALGEVMGQCLRPTEAGAYSGQLCLFGEVASNPLPFNDKMKLGRTLNSFAKTVNDKTHACRPPKLGVPGGASYRKCTAKERSFAHFAGGKVPDEICALAGGKAFDLCVASGDFAGCLEKAVVRGNRQTCGGDMYCRDDFMCQALPASLEGAEKVKAYGYCSPTYFLFQMRIDGHPDPVKGL